MRRGTGKLCGRYIRYKVSTFPGRYFDDGITTTKFGGDLSASSSQYITFVLRALGYQSGADFQWDKARELSDQLGFTKGQYKDGGAWDITVSGNNTTRRGGYFVRGDIATISYNALSMKLKGTDKTLLENVKGGASSNVGEHTHVYVTKTVPGSGHYEQVLVRYDKEPAYETRRVHECAKCGAKFDSSWDLQTHQGFGDNQHFDFSNPCLGARSFYSDAKVKVGEKEVPIYENKWVEDTIRVCSICGQQEP